MSKYSNPRHRKAARPLLAVGAFSIVTGLVLSTIAVIAGPIAPTEAATQYSSAGSNSVLTTEDDPSPVGDSPAVESDQPEVDSPPSLPTEGSDAPAPEAEQPQEPVTDAPADDRDSKDAESDGEFVGGFMVTNDGKIQNSSRSFLAYSYPAPSYPNYTPLVDITKSASVEATAAGDSYFYTLTVTNPGSADATGVVVSDPLPSDLTLDGTPTMPDGWTYALTTPGGVQTVNFTRVGSLAAEIAPQVFTIPVKVAANPNSEAIENTARVCAYNTAPECSTDTTYTPLSSLDVVVSSYCQQGAPYVHYDVTTHNIDLATHPFLTLQWAPSVGAIESWATRSFPSATSLSGDFLWPGATVDLDGNPTGWPGWTLSGGVWTFNPSGLGANLLDEPRFTALLGASATVTAEYPDLEAGCSGPPGYGQVHIEKTASVTAVDAGESFDYTLSVTNPGTAPAHGVVVTDTLPIDLHLSGTPTMPAGWSFVPTTELDGRDTLTFTLAGALANGVTPQLFTVPVTMTDVPTVDSVENSAEVCAEDTAPLCDSDDVVVPVKSIDLVVATICVGDVPYLHYDIAIHNVDLVAHDTVTFDWAPIAGPVEFSTTLLDAAPEMSGNILWPGAAVDGLGNATDWPGWSEGPGGWYFDPTAPGANLRDDSHVTVSINPTMTVTASYPPAASACANPPQLSDVSIEKTASVTATDAGDSFEYTVTVNNTGTDPATGVVVSDTLPADLTLNGTPTLPAGWSYALTTEPDGRQTLTFTLAGSLAGGSGPQNFVIPVLVSDNPSGSEIVNSASVCTDELAPACISDTEIVPVKLITLAVSAVCKNDVPYLHYDIDIVNVDLSVSNQVTFEWAPPAGPVEVWATSLFVAAPHMSGDILWPGAAVDSLGNATDWPGWSKGPGGWYYDPTAPGANLRNNAHVTVSINPTAMVTAPYPAATSACASPAQFFLSAESAELLPSAGVGAFGASAIALGSLALGCGLVLLYLARRGKRLGQ